MDQEIYKPWRPLDDIPAELMVYALYDDCEGVRVLLADVQTGLGPPHLLINFDESEAYRNLDECRRLKTFGEAQGFPCSCSLFTVENSRWLQWFNDENLGIPFDERIEYKHYSIITQADFIDVISGFEPIVEWLR
ncbi:hypothetical protein [Oceanidesulfovibrio marinus]|uniref:Uncharacterized protein n=1 Tax=Oceanidesulfovibrio marinus TaxID=370038 RepID=A0A6P1ZF37_9BACT|nr:hypothetical protein [Oceanidesulfovibrio marinus]QJT08496.1 hypothetical protein E8L03_05945 [Oceanidesulfovibrio marinus]TVM33038.1 hypothetical protein DQK91_12800 [Oceanidesulfovibrio marinus]